jgi:hypothetical protein
LILVTFEDSITPWRYGKWFKNLDEAKEYSKESDCRIVDVSLTGKKVYHDGSGFKEGYHPGLGMYINDRRQLREELKKRNLAEIGNEKPDFSFNPVKKDYVDNEVCKYLANEHRFEDKDIKELKDTSSE